MTLTKGDRIKFRWAESEYQFVGTWSGDYVFAPLGKGVLECQIYTKGEVEELTGTGEMSRLF